MKSNDQMHLVEILLQNFECVPSNLLGNVFVVFLFGLMLYEHISMTPMFEYFEDQQ
jgi:Na+/citrate or Na+/malate symporter